MRFRIQSAFSLSLIVFLLARILTPFEWDFYDGFNIHIISGIATRNVLKDSYLGFFFFTPLFTWLQTHFPIIPWMGATTMLLYFLVNSLLVLTLIHAVKEELFSASFCWLYSTAILLFFSIQFITIIIPSLTGLSLLLCGCAFLFIEKNAFHADTYLKKIALYLAAIFMYCCGAGIRFDTPLAASFVAGVFIVLNSKNLKKSIVTISPLLIVAAAMFLVTFNKVTHVPFTKGTEMDLYYISDGDIDNNFSKGFSEKDSIKTLAIKHFFLKDEEELTIGFIKSLTEKKITSERRIGFNLLTRLRSAWREGAPTILAQPQYLALNIFILFLLFHIRHIARWRALVFNLSFWLMVFTVAYLFKFEDRHFFGLAQIYSYCNLLFLLRQPDKLLANRNLGYCCAGVIILLFFFSAYTAYSNSLDARSRLRNLDTAEREVNRLASGKLLLLDGTSKDIFYGGPFTIRNFNPIKAIIYYDMGHLSVLPEYNAWLNDLCKCNSNRIVEFYDFLLANRLNLLVISTEIRKSIMQEYLRIVHQKNVSIKRVEGDFAIDKILSEEDSLHYYTIEPI